MSFGFGFVDSPMDDGGRAEIEALTEEKDQLKSQLAALEKDVARLDWLFAQLNEDAIRNKIKKIGLCYALRQNGCNDFRGAIDAAIKKEAP